MSPAKSVCGDPASRSTHVTGEMAPRHAEQLRRRARASSRSSKGWRDAERASPRQVFALDGDRFRGRKTFLHPPQRAVGVRVRRRQPASRRRATARASSASSDIPRLGIRRARCRRASGSGSRSGADAELWVRCAGRARPPFSSSLPVAGLALRARLSSTVRGTRIRRRVGCGENRGTPDTPPARRKVSLPEAAVGADVGREVQGRGAIAAVSSRMVWRSCSGG